MFDYVKCICNIVQAVIAVHFECSYTQEAVSGQPASSMKDDYFRVMLTAHGNMTCSMTLETGRYRVEEDPFQQDQQNS